MYELGSSMMGINDSRLACYLQKPVANSRISMAGAGPGSNLRTLCLTLDILFKKHSNLKTTFPHEPNHM